jgi:hypothetical protein
MLEELKEKLGPFPVWVWGAMGAIGFGAYLFLIRAPTRQTDASSTSGAADSTASPGTAAASNDVGGRLDLVNGQLNDLISRINGAGIGDGSGGGAGASQNLQTVYGALTDMGRNVQVLTQNQSDANLTSSLAISDVNARAHALMNGRDLMVNQYTAYVTALDENVNAWSATLNGVEAQQLRDEAARQKAAISAQALAVQGSYQDILNSMGVQVSYGGLTK